MASYFAFARSADRPAIEKKASPNVLFISVDTLRADHLGAYGGETATPHIDALAREGVLFERAVSHVPITLPSHASMLTGLYPVAHGVHDNGSFRLAEDEETLAETLGAAGYRTAAFVGSFALDSRFGLAQGFDHYDDFYGDTGKLDDFGISERRADAVLEPALEWIGDERKEPWFAFVHLYDPHAPYEPPPEFRGADPYSGEVAYVDDALGRFFGKLRERGALENTIIVFTSDHGEGLGEHGEKTHGMFAYDSTLHVPLIVSWKGVLPEGVRVPSRVRLVDLAPTLVELTGAGAPEPYQGESLVPLALAPGEGGDRESYFEAMAFHLNRGWAPLTGIYRDRLKYIELPIAELYDLEADPEESRNLYRRGAPESKRVAEALEDFVASHSTGAAEGASHEVAEETAARLRSLGYLVSPREREAEREYGPDDDPKNLVHLSDKLDAGVAAQLAGRSEESIRIFREILTERPSFSNAYANLAHVLSESGRLAEAIQVLETALERGAHTRTMLARLGFFLQEAGRLEESAGVLETVIEEDPTYAEAYNYLGVTYARLGRTNDALEVLGKLLTLDPSYASAHSNLGSVHLGARDPKAAEASFRRALEIDPNLARAWNGLGVVLAGTGREEEAVKAFRRSVELDPHQYETLYNLGTLLTKLNRFEDALIYLKQFVEDAPEEQFAEDLPKVRRLIAALEDATS